MSIYRKWGRTVVPLTQALTFRDALGIRKGRVLASVGEPQTEEDAVLWPCERLSRDSVKRNGTFASLDESA